MLSRYPFHHPHAWPPVAGFVSFALLLLLAGTVRAQAPAAPAPRPEVPTWAFGETVAVRQCLRLTVSDYRDRQGDVDNHDWVHVKAENLCRGTLRNLLVELLLIDAQNRRYGTPLWILAKGESLAPGEKREDDVAIPDPDSRVARRWTLRVLRVDGLPKPPPPPPKPQ